MKGTVIKLDKVTVVPFEQTSANTWDCVVIDSEHKAYPVGGYNISVFTQDLLDGTMKSSIAEAEAFPRRMAAAQAKVLEIFQNFGVVSVTTTMGISLPFNITMTLTWSRDQAIKMGLLKDGSISIDPALRKGESNG